jgi:hypothetical protein
MKLSEAYELIGSLMGVTPDMEVTVILGELQDRTETNLPTQPVWVNHTWPVHPSITCKFTQ